MHFEVRQISFAELVAYWRAVDHFADPHKVYSEVLSHLGPYVCDFVNPRRISYGLFHHDKIHGATHITQWTHDWLRVRTINISAAMRGRNLGWQMLSTALKQDWVGSPHLFGWFRDTAHAWAAGHGFKDIDGHWHDRHTGMLLDLNAGAMMSHQAAPLLLNHFASPKLQA